MVIEIVVPVFKCETDEDIFFTRLYELPGYDSVIEKGKNLYLTLINSSDRTISEKMQEICNVWNTTFRVLSEQIK